MVSLSKLMKISEEGCTFQSPYSEGDIFLTPESCMEIQVGLCCCIYFVATNCFP